MIGNDQAKKSFNKLTKKLSTFVRMLYMRQRELLSLSRYTSIYCSVNSLYSHILVHKH